jgi:hypothetical protein
LTDVTGELDEGSGEIVPISSMLPSRPSEYFRRNCFVTGSFMARFEVALRHEVGISQLLWGSDYPHAEGTWPHTKLSLRHTFHDVPEPDTRAILGGNAIEVFGLDEAELTRIAAQIGPTPDEVATPVRPEELPRDRGYAFRETGAFS